MSGQHWTKKKIVEFVKEVESKSSITEILRIWCLMSWIQDALPPAESMIDGLFKSLARSLFATVIGITIGMAWGENKIMT